MRRITVVFGFVVTSALLAAACGSSAKNEGEECVASSECKAGLICDFSQDPHVCRPEGSGPPPDADLTIPDANTVVPDSTPGAPDATPAPDASAPPDAPSGTALTVKNYASWCD